MVTRLLLVDDEDEVRRAFERLLAREGYEIESASNGREAFEKVAAGAFDVIISDVAMPEMNGVEFLRKVRERDLDVPVILITAAPELTAAIRAVELGAFRYLTKPVQPRQLFEVVERAHQLHRLARLKREALKLVGDGGHALGDRASLEARFDAALGGIKLAYQPIVSVKERAVLAYEGLLRTDEATLARPDHFLAAGERLGRLHDLGRLARAAVARDAATAPEHARLFVNVHAQDLMDEMLYEPATPLAGIARRVVIEITERAPLDNIRDLRDRVARLRKLGFRIAVDDLGAGYAGLTALAHLEPEVAKLDMTLARGIDEDAAKQRIVRSMVSLCQEMKVEMMVEGVETAAERDTLIACGCDTFQGYFFSRPGFGFATPADTVWP